jgi:hypothetical protein
MARALRDFALVVRGFDDMAMFVAQHRRSGKGLQSRLLP